ncbi:MAG: DUF47 family protein, partial [Nitrososphaeria archaeon]|nr:DUF47 family protein [Nitrososphaeria archaeon]NIN53259.1 DUF47 family protein [Nitrososphaeria archaeon]NIQ33710.1 DUF47 family protein [Nitrososphaeria archaeon]
MAFYQGAEAEARRRVLLILQDHIRNAVSVAEYLPQMVEALISDDNSRVEEFYESIKRIDDNSITIEKSLFDELVGVGPLLSSREELIRLVNTVSTVINSLEGSAYRITYFTRLRTAPRAILEKLLELSRKVAETVNSLRECVFLLSYNPSGILSASKRVADNEVEVDTIYRSLSVETLMSSLPANELVSINEVINRLEN